MEVKNLFEEAVKADIINRINQLTPQSQRQWGKMEVAQMLAHVQMPIKIALGTHEPKGNFLLRLIGPLFKSKLWDTVPYKESLPTDPTFIMTGSNKIFEKEKSELLQLIAQFCENNIARDAHPIFGKLTKEQWAKATWKHLDHHLRQFSV